MKQVKNRIQKVNNTRNQKGKKNETTHSQNSIWLCGKHATFSALQKKRRKIFQILVTRNTLPELEKTIQQHNLSALQNYVKLVDGEQISATIGRDQIHQGIAVNCSRLPIKTQNDLLEELYALDKSELPKLILLDQLSDPQNIGAIIRSAISFGVKKIIFCEHSAPKENAAMCKSSAGTIEMADLVVVVNFNNLIEKLKKIGYWCIGLDGTSTTPISEIKNYDNVALVVGSEGDGIRDLVRKNCDILAKINIDHNVESLNASVATSIALYELSRK